MYRSIQNLLERRVSLVNTLTNSTYAKDETRNETNNWNVATHSSRRKSLYRRAFRATRRKFGRPDSYRFEGMFAGCWRCRDSVGGGGIGGGGGGGGAASFLECLSGEVSALEWNRSALCRMTRHRSTVGMNRPR